MASNRLRRRWVKAQRNFAKYGETYLPGNRWRYKKIKTSVSAVQSFEQQELAHESDTRWLSNHEDHIFSQNGEDGIVREILKRLNISSGYFVECGASDGAENCTRALAEQSAWRGLWIEGNPASAKQASEVVSDHNVKVINEFVDKDNFVGFLKDAAVPKEFELLVLDVDGNDWWILENILKNFEPKVIVVEYNATKGLSEWVMPYDRNLQWQRDCWHGASLKSFAKLLSKSDYKLIATDTNGVNAFFVKADLSSQFVEAGDLREHFTPARYILPFGHPRAFSEKSIAPFSEKEMKKVRIKKHQIISNEPSPFVDLIVEVVNGSHQFVASSGQTPVKLAAWWGDSSHPSVEPERSALTYAIPPSLSRPSFVRIPRGDSESKLCIDIVQEGVRWRSDSDDCDVYQVTI